MSKMKHRPKPPRTKPWGNLAVRPKGSVWVELRAIAEWTRNKARGGRRR